MDNYCRKEDVIVKRSVRILAVAMVAVILCLALVSCGKTLSGKYEATILGSGIELEFDGKKVTYTAKVLGAEAASVEGTYEIKDDKITLSFDDEDKDAKIKAGTYDFEEGEDYIKIGEIGKLTKVEK